MSPDIINRKDKLTKLTWFISERLSKLGIEYSETPSSRMERIEPHSIQPWALHLRADTTRKEKDKHL